MLLLTAAVLIAVAGGPAEAANHVHVDEELTDVDRAALETAVNQARDNGVVLRVAMLATEPAGGAQAEADRLADRHGGTALVITPTEVGGASRDYQGPTFEAAGAAAVNDLNQTADVVSATTAFADVLVAAEDSGEGTNDGGWAAIVVAMVLIGGFIALVRGIRGRGQRRRADASSSDSDVEHAHVDDAGDQDGDTQDGAAEDGSYDDRPDPALT